MSRRILRSASVLFLMLVAASWIRAESGKVFENTVEIPRDKGVWVELSHEKVTLMWVETHNAPTDRDVEDAKKRDPKDKTPILVRFHYKNDGYVKQKVSIRAVLLDASGGVVTDGGRSGSLDARQKDDTFSFPVIVKTTDWPNAVKMKITATFR